VDLEENQSLPVKDGQEEGYTQNELLEGEVLGGEVFGNDEIFCL
jgi:hypothetical protein